MNEGNNLADDLDSQNQAMRAAYCEDIENRNWYLEEEYSGALRLMGQEQPTIVQAELSLRRSRS